MFPSRGSSRFFTFFSPSFFSDSHVFLYFQFASPDQIVRKVIEMIASSEFLTQDLSDVVENDALFFRRQYELQLKPLIPTLDYKVTNPIASFSLVSHCSPL